MHRNPLFLLAIMLAFQIASTTAQGANPGIDQYCGAAPTCAASPPCRLPAEETPRDERSCDTKSLLGGQNKDPGCEAARATINAQYENKTRAQFEAYRNCLAVEQRQRVNCEVARTDWNLCMARVVRLDRRIDQPTVDRPDGIDLEIIFRAGDQVKIDAGGCVQTGGHGKTWKHYVYPKPSDKYFGTIRINGVMRETKLSDVVGKIIDIPSSAEGAKLHLGYVDSNYTDNGYYDRDNGTEDQCKGVPDAFIRIIVTQPPKRTANQ